MELELSVISESGSESGVVENNEAILVRLRATASGGDVFLSMLQIRGPAQITQAYPDGASDPSGDGELFVSDGQSIGALWQNVTLLEGASQAFEVYLYTSPWAQFYNGVFAINALAIDEFANLYTDTLDFPIEASPTGFVGNIAVISQGGEETGKIEPNEIITVQYSAKSNSGASDCTVILAGDPDNLWAAITDITPAGGTILDNGSGPYGIRWNGTEDFNEGVAKQYQATFQVGADVSGAAFGVFSGTVQDSGLAEVHRVALFQPTLQP